MTQQVSLEYANPYSIQTLLEQQATKRQWRMVICGLLRGPNIWPLLRSPACRRAVDVAEKYPSARVNEDHLYRVHQAAQDALQNLHFKGRGQGDYDYFAELSVRVSRLPSDIWNSMHSILTHLYEHEHDWQRLVFVLSDVFCQSSDLELDPDWLTGDVRSLAKRIYDKRRFHYMPILADALEEAGCDNDEMLTHCRQGGEHVRGCWVVDWMLGKC